MTEGENVHVFSRFIYGVIGENDGR